MGCIIGRSREELARKVERSHVSRILMTTKSVISKSSSNKANNPAIGTRTTLISMLAKQGRRRTKSVKVANNNECFSKVSGVNGYLPSSGESGKRQKFSLHQQGMLDESKNRRDMFSPSVQLQKASVSTEDISPAPSPIDCASVNPDRNPAQEIIAIDDDDTEVILITSFQQLCHQVISKRILHSRENFSLNNSKALCLFVFGCQGSSKGELSIELAHHSTLVASNSCPSYFLIDVAALIVANIDSRIAEYNLLKAQTLEVRNQQAGKIDNQSTNEQLDADSISGASSNTIHFADRNLSICSNVSDLQDDKNENKHQNELEEGSDTKDFTQVTLNTNQRSILQLKLVKYFNSVTSRWVMSLIHKEVKRLEKESAAKGRIRQSQQIYLINLVPDQLSLFKSCLYLEQNLSFKELEYPYYAIKFEKTTSIKLIRKEKPPIETMEKTMSNSNQKHFFNLGNLKLSVSRKSSSEQLRIAAKRADKEHDKQNLMVNSASILAGGITDKLSTRHTEHFVHQFRSLNKLLRVRYNPDRDYNYACEDELLQNSDTTRSPPVIPCSRCSSKDVFIDSNLERDQLRRPSMARISPIPQATNQQQLSPAGSKANRAGSITSSAFTSADESDFSSFNSYQPNQRQRVAPIKWAIELHLFDSDSTKNITSKDTKGLKTISRNKSGRSGSIGSISSSVITPNKNVAGKEQYILLPSLIAYANGQTQVKYEVKQVSKRVVKLKKRSDILQINKKIIRAKLHVSKDCEEWLYKALDIREGGKVTSENINRHPTALPASSIKDTSAVRSSPSANLVVHTIRVDISSLMKVPNSFSLADQELPSTRSVIDKVQQPETIQQYQQLIPILVVNCDQKRTVSDSPDHGSSLIPRQKEKQNRHVRFRLAKAPPKINQLDHHELSSLKVQRRRWLEDNVFISAFTEDELACQLINDLVILLNSIKN